MDGEECLKEAYEAILCGDFEAAAHWFEQAVIADPLNASYHYRASISLARSGKLVLAERYANQAIQLMPNDETYRYHLKTIHSKKLLIEADERLHRLPPEISEARVCLREAIDLDPLSGEARLVLGIACKLNGDWNEALAAFREAISLNPLLEEANRLAQEVRKEQRRHWKHLYSTTKRRRNR